MKQYNIAIVGATGLVGAEALSILANFNLPIGNVIALASPEKVGETVYFGDKPLELLELKAGVFKDNNIDVAIFATSAKISKKFGYVALRERVTVIDNSSYFRLKEGIPLVVPGVNEEELKKINRACIIANPNCTTTQLVQVLKPLDSAFGIKRVDVATYQAVSGAGKDGVNEFLEQKKAFFDFKIDDITPKAFDHRIELNVIPHIGKFVSNGYTEEEMKIVNETQKILDKNMEISATCVRIPVLRSHSEDITIEFYEDIKVDKVREALYNAKYLVLYDDVDKNIYPMPLISTDTDETFVGRIRQDIYDSKKVHLWCCADQLRVGAATNALRILRSYIKVKENNK